MDGRCDSSQGAAALIYYDLLLFWFPLKHVATNATFELNWLRIFWVFERGSFRLSGWWFQDPKI